MQKYAQTYVFEQDSEQWPIHFLAVSNKHHGKSDGNQVAKRGRVYSFRIFSFMN